MSTASPGRPASTKGTLQFLNGSPKYLGKLVSTGSAVDNYSTATPFLATPRGPTNLLDTLAGRSLLLQSTGDGYVLPSDLNPANPGYIPITASLTGANPGVFISNKERVQALMLPTEGWLMWIPDSGSANLLIWELR